MSMADDKSRILVENGGGDEREEDGKPKLPVLLVKVKKEEEGVETWTIPEDKKRVCPHCKKEFNGGKALGGHMRVHGLSRPKDPEQQEEEAKRNKALKPNQTIKFKNKGKQAAAAAHHHVEINGDELDDHGVECILCPKTFPSKKSMFGHLRCHPERGWRGSEPPSTSNITSSSKLTRSFKSWSITAKRGSTMGSTISSASRQLIEEDKQLLEGAISFWLLINGKTRPEPPPEDLLGGDDDECTLNQLRDTVIMSSSQENKDKSSSEEEEDEDDHESSTRIISDSCSNERLLITFKNSLYKDKQRKLVDFDSSPPLHHNHWPNEQPVAPLKNTGGNRLSATPSYNHSKHFGESSGKQAIEDHGFKPYNYRYCPVCGLRFTGYHALGGHMSRHNKEERGIKGSVSTNHNKSSNKLQVNYPTEPQAIEGPHWTNAVARNDGGEHSTDAININGIDLNEAPQYEDYHDNGNPSDDDDDDSPGDSH